MRSPVLASPLGRSSRRRQRGVELVEFAFVSMIFFTLLLGIMEFGRWMFTLNAAGEATRWGAHLAAVCDRDAASVTRIKEKMMSILPGASESEISIEYAKYDGLNEPVACGASDCETVQVKLDGLEFTPLIPLWGIAVPVPPFTTSLPREMMKTTVNGTDNPVCN